MIDSGSDSEESVGFWDFKDARRFRRAFRPRVDLGEPPPPSAVPNFANFNPKAKASSSLGDFERLFDFCGIHTPVAYDFHGDISNPSTPPTSAPEDNFDKAELFERAVPKTVKSVQWKDQPVNKYLLESQRKQAAQLEPEIVQHLLDDFSQDVLDVECPTTPTPKSSRQLRKRPQHVLDIPFDAVTSLIPHSVHLPYNLIDLGPKPPPTPTTPLLDPSGFHPIYTLTNNEQKAKLIKKMAENLGAEQQEEYEHAIHRLGGSVDESGIHIFVDMSNIAIGYQEKMKIIRGIPSKQYIRYLPLSFSSLALILERGRKVARRVLVGSTISSPQGEPVKLHNHIEDARQYGYELNILERVSKPIKNSHRTTAKQGSGSGYATSGNSSASDRGANRRRNQEQAVDELLQMKMLESIVDTEKPSTIVLASGDAAEAEYSGGFLKNVERALSKGWKVEIVAWQQGLSYEYRSHQFLKKWGNQLRIIELDEFCEEMLAVYVNTYTQSVILQPDGRQLMCLDRRAPVM